MAGAFPLWKPRYSLRAPDLALVLLAGCVLAFTAVDGGLRLRHLRQAISPDALSAQPAVATPALPPAAADPPLATGLFGVSPAPQAGNAARPGETIASLGLKVLGLAYAATGAPSRALIADGAGRISVVGIGATLGQGLTVRDIGPDFVRLDAGGAQTSLALDVQRALARPQAAPEVPPAAFHAVAPGPGTLQPVAELSPGEQAQALREHLYGAGGR